jgi:hypothetical protein
MLIYLVVFTFSIFLFYLAEKVQSIRIVHILLLLMALFLPSILAGCRDLTIGVDVLVYVDPLFRTARYYNTYSLFSDNCGDCEPLYKLLVYISALFSNKISLLLFLQQFIMISAVYYSYSQFKNTAPSYIFFIVYFLLFFHHGFNMMRQMLAMSFCLISFSFLLKHKLIKSFIAFLPAIGFHSTAFTYLVIYPIFYFANKKAFRVIKIFLFTGICIPILLTLYIDDILIFMVSQNILSPKFLSHSTGLGLERHFGYTILTNCVLLFCSIRYSHMKNYNMEQYLLFTFILFICLISSPLGFFIHGIFLRCIFYFFFLFIILIPMALYNDKRICIPINLYILLMSFLLFCWYKNTVFDNECRTIPYTSTILGIQ